MQTIRSIAILGAVVASAASFVAPANANVPANIIQTQAHVPYRDLDLNSPEGQKELARRISHASTQVCGDDSVSTRFDYAACRSNALKSAREEARKAGAVSL